MRRSKEDAEQTRAAILDAAEAAFCEEGVASVSLERISRAAGVTRGAFYWHFKNKTDVLAALRERTTLPQEQIVAFAAEHGHEDPLGLLETVGIAVLAAFEADDRRQRLFRIMASHVRGDDVSGWIAATNAHMHAKLLRLTELAARKGDLASDFTPEEAAVVLMSAMNGLLDEWLRSDKAFSLTGLGAKLFRRQIAFLRARPALSRLEV